MRRLLVVFIGAAAASGAIACAAMATTEPAIWENGSRPDRAGSAYDAFPLWEDVPGPKFATLGGGKLSNDTRWAAYVSRLEPGKKAFENPCLTVASITRRGIYGHAAHCGPLAPATKQPPVYVSVSASYRNRPNGPIIGETAMALSFANSVTRVELMMSSGELMIRRTKLLNERQRRKTHLPPLRYLAMGLQRDVCVASVIGYDEADQVLFEHPTDLCPW
jgi:hypothetical protein